MAKIIFTSRYLRDAPPAQLENYVRYVGTREGVEKIDESKLRLPATVNQRSLIRQLVRIGIYLLRTGTEPQSRGQKRKLCGLHRKPPPCGACRGTWFIYRCG